jgi:hypothetical protein
MDVFGNFTLKLKSIITYEQTFIFLNDYYHFTGVNCILSVDI